MNIHSPERHHEQNITLRTNEGLHASINPQGAYIEQLTDPNGTDLVFPRQLVNGKDRGGIPVCAPIFGPGDLVGLKQHGFARNLSWEAAKSRNHDSRAEFVLYNPRTQNSTDVPEAYDGCQMSLQVDLQTTGDKNSVIMDLQIVNAGEEPFVVTPGFHPYFPVQSGDLFNVSNPDTGDYSFNKTDLATAQLLDATDEQVWSFKTDKHNVTISALSLSTPVIWTDTPGEYICVEPTAAGAATTSDSVDPALLYLQPGQQTQNTMRIDWSPLQTS